MCDQDYRDYWAQFNAIQNTLHKKLLKKPNFKDALKQLLELARAME